MGYCSSDGWRFADYHGLEDPWVPVGVEGASEGLEARGEGEAVEDFVVGMEGVAYFVDCLRGVRRCEHDDELLYASPSRLT